MTTERKSIMVSARLPTGLVERVDFVARNTDNPAVTNRSEALHAAVEGWLPQQEKRLEELGLNPKKTR